MKLISRRTTLFAACLSFGSAMAIAQQEQQEQSPYQTPAVVPQPTAVLAQPTAMSSPLILNLSGVTVTDQSGQPIGPIQHILLNPSGCVDLAVLSLGSEKLVPIPWRLVSGTGAARRETTGQATLAMRVDRTQLQQAPSFTMAQLSQLNQPQIIQQVNTFFGVQAQGEAAGGTGSQTTNTVGGATNQIRGATNQANAGLTNRGTNIPSPTGPTNAIPGRPAFDTNRPGLGPPANRPPLNRPPTNRPPVSTPGQPQPAQPK